MPPGARRPPVGRVHPLASIVRRNSSSSVVKITESPTTPTTRSTKLMPSGARCPSTGEGIRNETAARSAKIPDEKFIRSLNQGKNVFLSRPPGQRQFWTESTTGGAPDGTAAGWVGVSCTEPLRSSICSTVAPTPLSRTLQSFSWRSVTMIEAIGITLRVPAEISRRT